MNSSIASSFRFRLTDSSWMVDEAVEAFHKLKDDHGEEMSESLDSAESKQKTANKMIHDVSNKLFKFMKSESMNHGRKLVIEDVSQRIKRNACFRVGIHGTGGNPERFGKKEFRSMNFQLFLFFRTFDNSEWERLAVNILSFGALGVNILWFGRISRILCMNIPPSP